MKEQTDYFGTLQELLLEVSRDGQADARSLMGTALNHVLTMLDAQAGGVFLWDKKSDKLHFVAQQNVPDAALKMLEPGVSLDQIPYTGRAIQERRVILEPIKNYPSNSLMGGLLGELGYTALAALPLFSQQHTFGAISVGFTQERELTAIEYHALSLLGHQLGITLENLYLLSVVSRSEQRYRELVEGLGFVLWEYDPQTQTYNYFSPQAQKLTGYSIEQLSQPGFFEVILHPDDREATMESLNKAIHNAENCEMEYRIITKDGQILWARERIIVEQEEDRVRVRGAAVEITEQKMADERLAQMREQLIQQERLRALGQMASGIAHDFNNALMRIMGGLELLDMSGRLNQKQAEYLEMVRTSIMDASTAVARLREFYRPLASHREDEAVKLNPLIEEVVALTRPIWHDLALARGTTITVQTLLEDVPPVAGQASELREILTNLIFNAIDAMPQGGILTLQTSHRQGQVRLAISDTGIGMTDEVKSRCFDPFYTTKQESGSGLGLSVVYGIVQRMNGSITIDSQPGKGTTFFLHFPMMQTDQSGESMSEPLTLPPLSILIVEDEQSIRESIAKILTRNGHKVYTAADGTAALSVAKENSIELVLTDQGMPKMSGTELASHLKNLNPNIGVVLLTGWGDTFGDDGYVTDHIDFVLSKPLRREVLLNALAQVYDKVRCK